MILIIVLPLLVAQSSSTLGGGPGVRRAPDSACKSHFGTPGDDGSPALLLSKSSTRADRATEVMSEPPCLIVYRLIAGPSIFRYREPRLAACERNDGAQRDAGRAGGSRQRRKP